MARQVAVAAAVAATATIAGCHGSGTARLSVRDASQSSGVVPWIDDPAPEVTPAPEPTVTPAYDACTGSQLTATATHGGAAAGTYYESIRFRNSSDRPCTLSRLPSSVTGRHADGSTVRIDTRAVVGGNVEGPSPANLSPGDDGWITLSTPDGCDAVLAGRKDMIDAVDVTLGNGDRVHADLPAPMDVVCGAQASEFGAPPPPAPEESSPLDVLTARAHVPDTIAAGQPLEFTVTLSNGSDHDVALSPCPSYQEGVFPTGSAERPSIERYFLNCSVAAEIPAGAAVTFAMRLDVPDGHGTAKFFWNLQGTTVGMGLALTVA